MGYRHNYSRLEDFIYACKDHLRDDDVGLQTVFFDIQYQQVPTKFQNGAEVVDGTKINASVYVSAVSRDGLEYMTHLQQIGVLNVVPGVTKEQVEGFMAKMEEVLQNQFVQIVEEKFESANKKRGSCEPTVS